VNIWPRPYEQSPHPPIWITTLSSSSAYEIVVRDYVLAIIMNGPQRCREIFDVYRQVYREAHGRPAPLDKLSYTAFVYVGDTNEIERNEGHKVISMELLSTEVLPRFRALVYDPALAQLDELGRAVHTAADRFEELRPVAVR
jgi:hypothetical protein